MNKFFKIQGRVCRYYRFLPPQVKAVSAEWAARADLPPHVANMIKNFPSTLHPMSQLSAAVTALQSESKFAKAYSEGVHKTKYWESTYEDAMDLIAKLPPIAATIYRNTFYDGQVCETFWDFKNC